MCCDLGKEVQSPGCSLSIEASLRLLAQLLINIYSPE